MFGTSGIRGPIGETVTAEVALGVGRALGVESDRVVVGRDPRESGRFLTDALVAGLCESGCEAVRLGLAGTPTVARAVGWCDGDAGVSVTASHNPPTDNGLKLWQPSGQAFDADGRARITDRLESGSVDTADWDAVGASSRWDGAGARHVSAIRETVPDVDLTVALDLGTGAGGVSIDALEAIGCSVTTLNAQPDGAFPARPSEPTAEHCATLRAFVAGSDADLGLAHDGDADRLLAVDETGAWVSGDALLALFARNVAGRGDRVAVPVDTSLRVADALEPLGAEVVYTPVGDVHVAERAAASDVVFGGEPSGAWIWPEETLCPDGPLAATRLAALVAERGPLSTLVADLPAYPIRRTSIETGSKRPVVDRVKDRAADAYGDVDALDGVRVALPDGWFLVRASGTEPVVRITAEARESDRVEELLGEARELVDAAIEAVSDPG